MNYFNKINLLFKARYFAHNDQNVKYFNKWIFQLAVEDDGVGY